MKKYFLLKRNNSELLQSYLLEFDKSERLKIKVNENHDLLLIEKTCFPDHTEKITNLWTINEGCPILWEKYTKKRLTYDYTGVVNPIIHLKGNVMTFDSYCNLIKH